MEGRGVNTAVKLVQEVEAAGGNIVVDGGRLKLSGPEPLHDSLIDELRQHKAEVIGLLAGSQWGAADWLEFYDEKAGVLEYDRELSRAEAEGRALEMCIVEWLNRTLVDSEPDQCAWCGMPEDGNATVLPFGTMKAATWLHGSCWGPWHRRQRQEAESALAEMGIGDA